MVKKVDRDLENFGSKIFYLYDLYLDGSDELKYFSQVQSKKKRNNFYNEPMYKYVTQVLRTVGQARQIEEANENTFCQVDMDKEVNKLLDLDCF